MTKPLSLPPKFASSTFPLVLVKYVDKSVLPAQRERLMGKLNHKAIDALKPGQKIRKYSDGDGLYLIVSPEGTKGTKWWRFDYRFAGKQRSLSLGPYSADGFTLAEARDKAIDMRRMVRRGIDPSAERKAVKQAVREKAAEEKAAEEEQTFAKAATAWRDLIDKRERSPKTRARDDRMIRYLVEAFGQKPIRMVRKSDLVALLDSFEK